jgi:hypothetical protein
MNYILALLLLGMKLFCHEVFSLSNSVVERSEKINISDKKLFVLNKSDR